MKLKKIKNQLKTLKKFRFLVSCLIYDESRYYFIRSTYITSKKFVAYLSLSIRLGRTVRFFEDWDARPYYLIFSGKFFGT